MGCRRELPLERSEPRTVTVNVPAGVADGQILRLVGQGEPLADHPSGHLYVVLTVRPHPRFSRRDADLVVPAEVPPALARTGGTLAVESLHGRHDITVPVGARTGDEVVVRGHGLQRVGAPATPLPVEGEAPYRAGDTGGRGDLIVRLHVPPRGLKQRLRWLFRFDE